MAQLVNVRLNRSDAQPWGFRLQGGKDFGTPLVVQKVAGGSIAANAGLVAGDAVIKVNGLDVYNLRHKDAQDAVVRGGNGFEITVQRGGSTWRPTVTPTGTMPSPTPAVGGVAPVTRTSLAAKPQEVQHIGSGFNSAARPFGVNGGDGVKSIVNKQYNTPVGIYSDESIAETLSAQTEVLAGGVLGVNFKKNEKIYNSANSEVFKMLQEAENDPNEPAGESKYYWTASHAIGGQATCTSPFLSPGASHRPSHPINLQEVAQQEKTTSSYSASMSSYQENTKLSASTISAALTTHHGSNVGVSNGAPQLGSPLPAANNLNTSLSGPKPFSSGPLSPPSTGPKSPSIYPPPTSAAAWSQPKAAPSFEAPKASPFGSATLPRATVGTTAPGDLGPECGHPDAEHFMWPPPNPDADNAPTATPLYVPPPGTQHMIVKPMVEKQSQSAPDLSYGQSEMSRTAETVEMESGSESYTSTTATTTSEEMAHRMFHTQTSVPSYTVYESADSDANETDYAALHHKQSICSAEVSSFVSETCGAQYLADTLDTTCLVERMRSLTPRPPSPPPIKPAKHVEFAIPSEEQTTEVREATQVEVQQVQEVTAEVSAVEEQSTQFQPIDIPEQKPLPQSNVTNTVPQEWESAMVKALKTAPETPYNIVSVQEEVVEKKCEKLEASQSTATTTFESVNLPQLDVLVEKPAEGTIMSSLLATVPSKSVKFEPKVTLEPIPLPEETKPYFPPPINMKVVADDSIPGRKSGMLEALITAPDRPYSPFGHEVSYQLDDMPRPTEQVTLRSALTVAPDRPFTPVLFDSNGLAHPTDTICSTFLDSVQNTEQRCNQLNTSQSSAFQSIKTSSQESQFSASQSCRQECRETVCQQVCQSRQAVSEQSKTVNRILVDTAATAFEQGQSYVDDHEKRITFPPPNPLALRQSRFSNLHAPDNIPVYQKKILQPILPPVSPQLRENVPLAFFDAGRESLPHDVAKPVAINGRSGRVEQNRQADKHEHCETYAPDASCPITMTFQSLDGIDMVNRAADVPTAPPQISSPILHPRPFTPSLINKPAPIIPYYQQNLAVSEFDPHMGEIFDPKLRSPSPCLREKSPAQGPPPNPLRIQAPRLRESGEQAKLPPGTAYSNAQMQAQSVYQQKPELLECQRIGDSLQHTRTNEASLSRSMHAAKESASATQVGNTFIQKRSRVVEDFERTQTAKTVEITKSGAGEIVSKITEDEMPPKGIVANQTRRFSQEVAPPKVTFPASIPLAPMQFPIATTALPSSNTVAPPPGFNLKSLNSAFASSKSTSSQNFGAKSTLAFTNTPPADAAKPASGPANPPKPQTPPPTNNCPSTAMSDPSPDASAGPNRGGAAGVTSAPKRGRGVLNKAVGPGGRIPQCGCCNSHIRGPFITALGRIWCPDHFICVNAECRRPLADIGFVEEKGNLYCEYCFEKYIAPACSKCGAKIKGDCLNAIGKHFHPECFTCAYCGKLFGNSPFFLEEGNPYCEADWNELFTTKCFACGFPVEAGDRWVEALSHNYHSQCFNCTTCKKNLEGQSFFAKGGRPYCKNHAR